MPNDGRFLPGQSGNPSGRPPKLKDRVETPVQIVTTTHTGFRKTLTGEDIHGPERPDWDATARLVLEEALSGKRGIEEARAVIALIQSYRRL